ncbi:alpha/beta fold hydrolase [Rhodospirillum centenum]|uniref:Hydrolase, alpha n=1 Tax=Rhodospirillum centenum (strain ATCC 51521 / SW) TaxID=414684 RepID=B6IQI9_RHOCS|nr:alpha/beta fold hydrolase [Rhodospirillum centenum]ACI97725.1 hydrolase, alpha [Rhodospirillum centenum SW]
MKLSLPFLVVLVASLFGLGVWLHTPDRPRDELEALYLRSPADYVQAAGMRLHVRDDGPRDAPAVVMLHGFGASLHTWEGWAQGLAGPFRVVRFDLPGFALTGPDPTGDYGDERAMVVLEALLDRLGIARASLIGNSIGGRIAWKFAALHPDRVEKLVLVSPDGFASPGFEYGRKAEVPGILNLMRFILPTAAVRANLQPAYGDPAVLTDQLTTRYRDLMLAPGVRDAMFARLEQVMLEPPEPLLRRIQAPTLLLWGEKDAMIPVSNAADYARALHDSRTVTFPDLGHVPQEEAPARSLEPVRKFLAEGYPGLDG